MSWNTSVSHNAARQDPRHSDSVAAHDRSAPNSNSLTQTNLVHSPQEVKSLQTKKLLVRKARFKATAMSAMNVTPIANAWPRKLIDYDSTETLDSSPSDHLPSVHTIDRGPLNELGILREISNSSLRRKATQRPELGTVKGIAFNGGFHEDDSMIGNEKQPLSPNIQVHHPTSRAVASGSDFPRASRGRTTKRSLPRRSVNGETPKYIEHLESQLAVLQTQLVSLTSPSSNQTLSAKLRAMTSETRLLRQEVTAWENKFHDRLREQLEQHEITTDELRCRIRTLERLVEQAHERVKELEIELEERVKSIEVAESANYDLERRLEFMSELLATSPRKVDSHSNATPGIRPRPKSMGPPRMPSTNSLLSPTRSRQVPRQRDPDNRPASPTPQGHSNPWDESPFGELLSATTPVIFPTDLGSEAESGHLNVSGTSPSRRESTLLCRSPSREAKIRPTRRMRRFYTGSMGPRSLILPATAHAGLFPAPALFPVTPTPSIESMPLLDKSFEYGAIKFGGLLISQHPTRQDEDFISAHIVPPPSTISSHSSMLPPPVSFRGRSSHISAESSIQSAAGRILSLGEVQGRNLFEELSHIKQDHDSGENTPSNSRPWIVGKHMGSPIESSCSTPRDFVQIPSPPSHVSLPNTHPPPETCVSDAATKRLPPTPPKSTLSQTTSVLSRALDSTAPSASRILTNAWSIITLSRPVLHFRWWLARLLLGDLHRKRWMLCASTNSPIHTSSAPSTPRQCARASGRRLEDLEADACNETVPGPEGDEEELLLNDPGYSMVRRRAGWLKLSMTLVFAVFIVIRDGPEVLFRADQVIL